MNGAVNYLKLLITGDDSQLDATLKKSKRTVTGYADDIADSMGGLGKVIGGVLAGISVAGFVGKLVSVQREFDVLNSSLKTVTGSSAAAEREMAWLKDFAKSTPFGLAQATDGFVKMKALGLDPTRAALNSFGNTASAMGKDLNQMIEAVADASTGEFERLKEFGIKASKEGNKVSFTFQGVTTTIKNSSSEITKYLENIGNTTFGGAMEERAKTLDGIIAGLGDTWDELFRTINSQQAGSLIFDSVTLANSVLEDATVLLRAMGGASADAAKDAGTLAAMQGGVATFFETVAVMAAETLYVLRQTGDTLGGLAAGYAAFFSFDFDAVRAIGAAMKENGEAARRELDATTSRIMNARKEQALYDSYATRNASAATDPRRVDLGGKPSKPTVDKPTDTKGLKAAENSYKSLKKSVDDYVASMELEAEQGSKLTTAQKLQIQLDGLLSDGKVKVSAATVQGVRDSLAKAKKLEDEAAAAKRAVAAYQEYLVLQDELNADYVAQSQAREQGRKSVDEYNTGIRESGELLQLELSMMDQSEQARGIAIEQYRIELELKKQIAAVNANSGFDQGQRNEMIASLQAGAAIAKAQASSKVFLDGWKSSVSKYDDIFSQGFADMLNNGQAGWGSFTKSLVTTFKTSVADQIYKMFLRPLVVNVVGNLMGMESSLAGAGGAGAASGGRSALDIGGSVQSLWSNFSGGITGSLGTTIAGLGATLGSTAATAFGSGIVAGGQLGVFGGAIGQGATLLGSGAAGSTAAGLGTMAGAAIPWVAAAMAVYALITSMDDSGTPHMGAGAVYSQATGVQGGPDLYNQNTFGMGHRAEYNETMQEGISGIAKGLGETLDQFAIAFGQEAGYSVATAFADDSSDDGSWGSLRVVDSLGKVLVDWAESRESSWAPRVYADGTEGYTEYLKELANDIKAPFMAMDAPRWSKDILKVTNDFESLTAALQKISQIKTLFDGLGQTMTMFADISGEVQTRLIYSSGGVEALGANVSAFYQEFYSENERMQKQRELQMKSLGVANLYIDPYQGGAAKELFRQTVEDAMKSGQIELAAKLMAMSAPFAAVADHGQKLLDDLAEAAKVSADIAKESAEKAKQAAADALEVMAGLAQGYASQMTAAHSAMDAAGALWDRLDSAQGGSGTGFSRIREQRLWGAMAEADYRQQIELAGQLTDMVLSRHQLEQANAEKLLDFGKSLRSYPLCQYDVLHLPPINQ